MVDILSRLIRCHPGSGGAQSTPAFLEDERPLKLVDERVGGGSARKCGTDHASITHAQKQIAADEYRRRLRGKNENQAAAA